MKILMISHMYYPTIGGVQNVVDNLSQQCIKYGHSVEIVTSRYPKDLPRSEAINGIQVTRLPFRLPELSLFSLVKFFIRSVECIFQRLFFYKKKFDVINLHYISENAIYALFLMKLMRIPLITNMHGADIEDFPLRNKFNRFLVGQTLKQSTRIISNSNNILKKATDLFGKELLDKSVVIGNGIDLAEFDCLEKSEESLPPFILGIGRFVPKKGFDILIKAFSLVVEQYGNSSKLILIGDGPERKSLEALAKELGSGQSIQFCGLLQHEEALQYFHRCLFFVLPSRKEPFGIVNLEAMAAQKAVIAIDVGGISDYLCHMENGLLVKDQTPEALADAIIFLLEHLDLALQLGKNGRKMVETRFTWETIADQFLETAESVLHAQGRR